VTVQPLDLYTDGGVIGVNPSPIGGTWAYCIVDTADDQRVTCQSGVITPEQAQLPAITNNLTELLAIVNGREALPWAWTGTIHSDSRVSLQRVFLAAKLNNVPPWLVERLQTLQRDGWFRGCGWVLLDRHPTRAQLAAGVGKRGGPVSVHNKFCDSECTRRAREAVAQ
jgi:ribonuclease HI